jgi:hypothetical protein
VELRDYDEPAFYAGSAASECKDPGHWIPPAPAGTLLLLLPTLNRAPTASVMLSTTWWIDEPDASATMPEISSAKDAFASARLTVAALRGRP